MHGRTATWRSRSLIGLLAVFGLVLVSASPAIPQTEKEGEIAGAGGGTGFEVAHGDITEECIPGLVGTFPGSTFELNHEGTYDGVSNAQTIASYVGPSKVKVSTGPYILGPEGTYTECRNGVPIPGPVAVNGVQINGTSKFNGVSGSISCNQLEGTFERRDFDVVKFILTGSCTVTGNVAPFLETVVDDDVTHVITGVMQPCPVPVPPLDTEVPAECVLYPNADSILVTDYVAVPEKT